MRGISGFEDYKVLSKNRNSRYVLLRHKSSRQIAVADIIDMKILHVLKSRRCNYSYVRPKTIFVSIPRIEYLVSNRYFADVFFLNDFNKSKTSGIIILEDEVLTIFNSHNLSKIEIKDVKKIMLSMCYEFHEISKELVTGYELKIEFLNSNRVLQQLEIEISDRKDIQEIGGVSINNITSFKNEDISYVSDKASIDISNDKRRKIELNMIHDFITFEDVEYVRNRGLCNVVSLWHYLLLR